jgi:uncharacterized protein YprB with RNaseH-like and TPR domain
MIENKEARILFFDIETTPNVVYTWGRWEQDVIDVIEDWKLLCFAYKWLGDKKVYSIGTNKSSEKALVKTLWDLFNEADVIVAHNGDNFDVKKMNSLFIKFGMKPPAPYKTIDTKKVAKRYFRFDSNKLDELGRELGLGRKIHTGGFELWKGCMAGDKESWRLMLQYNEQDVVLLEKVYMKLRTWMTNHPNLNLLNGETCSCPNCGGHKLHKRGFSITRTSKAQRYQCQDCGAWSHGKTKTEHELVTR